jgi:hypothetical protein
MPGRDINGLLIRSSLLLASFWRAPQLLRGLTSEGTIGPASSDDEGFYVSRQKPLLQVES